MSGTKKCSECGKKMLLVDTGFCQTTYPAKYPQEWCCGCGHRVPAPTRVEKTQERIFMELWEEANRDE